MTNITQDIRYALRTFRRNPGFALLSILALALGIGATTTVFSLANAIFLKPLGYRNADRVVGLWEWQENSFSGPDFVDLKKYSTSFAALSLIDDHPFNLTGDQTPESVDGFRVSSGFFRVLGTSPELGRTFLDGEDQSGANPVSVVSDGLWRNRFASDPGICGKLIRLDGKDYTIVGVMPAGFAAPYHRVDVFTPYSVEPGQLERGNHFLRVIGLLKPGVSLGQARSDATRAAGRITRENPKQYTDLAISVTGLQEWMGAKAKPALTVLLAAVFFVLLIACANVAGMLSARAIGRQREISIRSALGASRFRIVRQLLTECILLSIPAGVVGLALAQFGTGLFIKTIPESILNYFPGLATAGVDGRVLAVTFAVSLFTGVTFGLAPALNLSRVDINSSLKESGTATTHGRSQNKVATLLAAAEVALAVVLLVGAGLMVRSVVALVASNPGLDPVNLLTVQLTLPNPKYKEPATRTRFLNTLVDKIRALPGVQSAGMSDRVPLSSDNSYWSFGISDSPAADPNRAYDMRVHFVSEGCLKTLRVPLRQGRDFTRDDRDGAPPVVIVNEKLAESFWPGESAVGKSLGGRSQRYTIIGVAGNVVNASTNQYDPQVYLPYLQDPFSNAMSLMIRTAGSEQSAIAQQVREAVASIDPDQSVAAVTPMSEVIHTWATPQRLTMWLLGVFAVAALLLSGLGVYGVMAYSVTRRLREMGVRMALGASRRDLLKLVFRGGLTISLSGMLLGLVGAIALARLMSSLLYGVTPGDPATFASTTAVLLIISLAACYFPARRAARVDPVQALRHE